MFKAFYPYKYEDSVFSIDYEKLYEKGFRGIIFDIDNTLVPHGADSTEEVDGFFRYIQGLGFKTLLLSNNDDARVQRFLKNIDSLYVCDAEKPSPKGYLKAVDMLGLSKNQVVVIGDQIFTDVYGANRSGLPSILVKYIGYGTTANAGRRRKLENFVLYFYKRNKSCFGRLGGIHRKET